MVYLVYDGLLANAEGAIGAALPAGSSYILKEILLKNTGAGVNRAQIRLASGVANEIVDESLPASGAAGCWLALPFSTAVAAATQFYGVATTAAEVHCRITAQRTTP